jgi:hypothetical protein
MVRIGQAAGVGKDRIKLPKRLVRNVETLVTFFSVNAELYGISVETKSKPYFGTHHLDRGAKNEVVCGKGSVDERVSPRTVPRMLTTPEYHRSGGTVT